MLLLVLLFVLLFFDRTSRPASLPNFLIDYSDVILNAIIERNPDTPELHLVVMMMGHKAFFHMPQAPILMMNTSLKGAWGRIAKNFRKNIAPLQTNCSFSMMENSQKKIEVCGTFVNTWSSVDSGFNHNIELLRCPIPRLLLDSVTHVNSYLQVSLTRQGIKLLSFSVSTRKRQAGYGISLSRKSSRIDLWQSKQSFHKQTLASNSTASVSASISIPTAFLCSSVIRPLEPNRPDVALSTLLEFVEHNVQIGFKHQFLGTFLDSQSIEYHQMLAVLQHYIAQKLVSLTALSPRGVNDASGTLGLIFIDDYTRFIHQNACLYISRGLASHVVLLHASEFLALSPPKITHISQLLRSLPPHTSSQNLQEKSPCYYKLYNFGVDTPTPESSDKLNPNIHFLFDFYSSKSPLYGPLPAFNIAILPTHTVDAVAWHYAASCKRTFNIGLDKVGYESSDYVSDSDAYFVPASDAAVYFYRQGKFDPWQTMRKTHATNNHSLYYGRNAENSLIKKGIALRHGLGGLQATIRYPALEGRVGGVLVPKGKDYMIENGMLECQSERGCKYFGSFFNLTTF